MSRLVAVLVCATAALVCTVLAQPANDSAAVRTTRITYAEAKGVFQQLREEAGLAYDVHSFQTDFADCGTLQIYAGVDPADLESTTGAILAELRRMVDEPVAIDELERARAFASGRMELRLEESRHMSAWLGIQEALHERVLTLDQALAELDKVTPAGIQSLAQRLFTDDRLCMAVISPRGTAKRVERVLHLN